MPYIKQTDRKLYEQELNQLVDKLVEVFSNDPTKIAPNRAGHMNYLVTSLVKRFYTRLQKKLVGTEKLRYSDWNEIIGFLEAAKLEMYRRQVGPYEDEKIGSEGDV